ncbi:MAG: LysR family transcriptional regulator [Janthinobacterium lividum]
MRSLKLSALEMFCAVIEEGSMAAAARRVNCVPSNIVARMKELESDLGEPLFHREKGKISATPFARIFHRETRDLLDRADQLTQYFQQDATLGLLKVGALDVAMLDYLPARLPRFLKDHARSEISLQCQPSFALERMLGASEIDVALTDGPITHPLFESCPAYTEDLYLVANQHASRITDELLRAPVFLFDEDCFFRPHFKSWLANRGVAQTTIQTIESYETITACVAAGLGISCFPGSVAARIDEKKQGVRFLKPDDLAPSGVHFVWRRNGMTHLLDRFIQHCVAPSV